MSPDAADQQPDPVELLHPFYLDTDMSMAFAAALAGGVALEREDIEHDTHESEAVRNLRGNLRLFGALGFGGGAAGVAADRETKEADVAATESRLVRHHTEASIFIALHDELRRTHRISDGANPSTLRSGDIVSLAIGPAVAPLRRVVDQFIRLIDVGAPLIGLGGDPPTGASAGQTRQQRRQDARQAVKQATAAEDQDSGVGPLRALRSLLVALQDDLDRSGMLDVVIADEDGPSVVLTLDKRFVSDQALELLHTSRFTVIGKVTQVWPTDAEFVNLYRRSVISLVPALGQTVGWGMFTLLATLAGSLDPAGAERAAYAAAGLSQTGTPADATSDETKESDDADDQDTGEAATEGNDPADGSDEKPEIMLGDVAVQALNPGVSGPAIQILPLAICA
jgi:hypothetical protein